MSTATRTEARSGLHTKLAFIRGQFGPILKTGEMKEGPRFKYVEARVLADRFVELASQENLTMLPVGMAVVGIRPTASGKQTVTTLLATFRVTDGDTGEFIDLQAIGEGSDSSDKGAPKAQTNAMKYALLLLLQAAGEDAEADGKSQKIESDFEVEGTAAERLAARRQSQASVPQASAVPQVAEQAAPVEQRPPVHVAMATDALKRKIRARAREVGLGDFQLKAFSTMLTGKSSSKDWTMGDADRILANLDEPAKVDLFKDVQEPSV